jgi:hypothetical protein
MQLNGASVKSHRIPIRPPSGREFNRVGKQVEQYLFDLTLVSFELAKTLIDINVVPVLANHSIRSRQHVRRNG